MMASQRTKNTSARTFAIKMLIWVLQVILWVALKLRKDRPATAMRGWRRWRHRYLLPIVSRLPESFLQFLDRHWQLDYDPSDGWTFWMDASYAAYCRREQK
jgi:hypothetical protein